MFWRMAGLSTTSPVESLLDKDTFTLEELLDEDELIQECKSLNTRLINFLRMRSQIEQLLRYVVEEPLEGSDSKRTFKFPFLACEIFTCEIDVILKIVVEDEELMGLLFSFLNTDRPHGTLLAGYFSKVVICLLLRKTAGVMSYLQAHQEILKKLVDLIGITSIMEVLIRLVGADESMNVFHEDSHHWLGDADLLEMLMEKLSPPNPSEAHANAAEVLSAVSRLSQSALAAKLASPSYIARLFNHALEDPDSKSTLVHSLSVCVSLLDPKKYVLVGMCRGHYIPDSTSAASPDVIEGMLQRLGDLLKLLDVSSDERVLPTTYGELRPPLGTHRLKIVEFIAVLLRTNSEGARQALVQLGAIQTVIRLFFEYPFNNLLHHQVENIVASCLESNSKLLIDHLLENCDLVGRLLEADGNTYTLSVNGKPTKLAPDKSPPRIGLVGHLTRIANRLVQAANNNPDLRMHLQGRHEWLHWQANTLQSRNLTENVCQWTCGRPTSVRDRPVDNDDVDTDDYDFRDGANAMAQHLTREVFRYDMFDNEDTDEGLGATERDDDDVFFDDDSAEVVISSLRLGEEHDSGRLKDSFLSRANWFAFSDDSSSSDDEVVVGEDDELVDTATSSENASLGQEDRNGLQGGHSENGDGKAAAACEVATNSVESLSLGMETMGISDTLSFGENGNLDGDPFSARPPDWANWKDSSSWVGTSGRMVYSSNNPFKDDTYSELEKLGPKSRPVHDESAVHAKLMDATSPSNTTEQQDAVLDGHITPLFDDSIHFVGVDVEGTAKGMEHALREGIVGEAAPIHAAKHGLPNNVEAHHSDDATGDLDFNDVNYWKSEYSQPLTDMESS